MLGLTGFKGLADRTSTSFLVPISFPFLPGPCSFARLSDEWKRGRNPVGTGRRKAEGIRTVPRFTVSQFHREEVLLLYREHTLFEEIQLRSEDVEWAKQGLDLSLCKYNLLQGRILLPLGGRSRNCADSDCDIISMILRLLHPPLATGNTRSESEVNYCSNRQSFSCHAMPPRPCEQQRLAELSFTRTLGFCSSALRVQIHLVWFGYSIVHGAKRTVLNSLLF